MIEKKNNKLSIRRQCDLLGINRSRLYYEPAAESQENLKIMSWIDKEFTDYPFTGVGRMVERIARVYGVTVNHKRIRRLMREMALIAVYPKPWTSQSIVEHVKYPCLIRSMDITESDQLWCSDITYIRLRGGFMYLVVIMDYFSRYVVSWAVSNSLESLFCLDALDGSLAASRPMIFHCDQGRQYTCDKFIKALQDRGIEISMSGKGRCFDNIVNERLWRTVKYEEVYLRQYANGHELMRSLRRYFDYYNNHRPHMSLDYRTPSEVYFGGSRAVDSLRLSSRMAPLSESTGPLKTLQLIS